MFLKQSMRILPLDIKPSRSIKVCVSNIRISEGFFYSIIQTAIQFACVYTSMFSKRFRPDEEHQFVLGILTSLKLIVLY